MINFCSYVQWVPKSDVVVAQSGENLSVWYNTDLVEQLVQIPIQGDVEMVLRDMNRTEVIVQVGYAIFRHVGGGYIGARKRVPRRVILYQWRTQDYSKRVALYSSRFRIFEKP